MLLLLQGYGTGAPPVIPPAPEPTGVRGKKNPTFWKGMRDVTEYERKAEEMRQIDKLLQKMKDMEKKNQSLELVVQEIRAQGSSMVARGTEILEKINPAKPTPEELAKKELQLQRIAIMNQAKEQKRREAKEKEDALRKQRLKNLAKARKARKGK